MKLHNYKNEFKQLISIVAYYKHLPEEAIERDYYIVMMLKNLEKSIYSDYCVFKGGTSLSKCYPNSIERFSEDIDLTFIPINDLTEKQYDRELKKIEEIITEGFNILKIDAERNNKNKSSYVWLENRMNQVKLEIGCSVRPEPFSKKSFKSYIHEYLEEKKFTEELSMYELEAVTLNVLNIERTFLDKVFAVKRHAICKTLETKVRHIYDVVKLYRQPEIKSFLMDKEELKKLILLTKNTDSIFFEKRKIYEQYNLKETYNFNEWKNSFDSKIIKIYESLHKTLLYTDEKQEFKEVIDVFEEINLIFEKIGE
jgi:predicted nucleotidyltransferase component of viral defense system